ncbi:MAG: hypothetical protein Crog4KO_36760 [Crocinitomicaceae bacterium]
MSTSISDAYLTPELKDSIEKQLASDNSLDMDNEISKVELANLIFHTAKDNQNISPNQPVEINLRTFMTVLTLMGEHYNLGGLWLPYGTESNSLHIWRGFDNPTNFFEASNFNVGSETLSTIWIDI